MPPLPHLTYASSEILYMAAHNILLAGTGLTSPIFTDTYT